MTLYGPLYTPLPPCNVTAPEYGVEPWRMNESGGGMLLRMVCHSLITLGATVALTLLLSLNADAFITIWLAFASVACLAEFLRDGLPTPTQTRQSVLDLFERIEQ